jgi:hypothetical protein
MENLKSPEVMGKKIFKLINKYKILLLQDKAFPSIVTEIIGSKVSGSWWGHPLANPIYNGLSWLEHNKSVLSVKLIDGKVTYLDESLFSDFYSIVCEPRDWQVKNLKEDEQRLLKYISQKKKTISSDPKLGKLAKDTKKSFQILEKKLLVYSIEEHTASGKHIKEYMPWSKSKISVSAPTDYFKAKDRIENIVKKLSHQAGAKVKLPW